MPVSLPTPHPPQWGQNAADRPYSGDPAVPQEVKPAVRLSRASLNNRRGEGRSSETRPLALRKVTLKGCLCSERGLGSGAFTVTNDFSERPRCQEQQG